MNKIAIALLVGAASAESPMVGHSCSHLFEGWFHHSPSTHHHHSHHWFKWVSEFYSWGKYHASPEDEAEMKAATHKSHHWSVKNQETHDSPFYEFKPKQAADEAVPTAVFHGFGDACVNPGMASFTKKIGDGTGAYSKCIEVGLPSIGEIINNFEHVAEVSCKKVAADPKFQGEFNVIGLSQGGLLARYIAESCDMPGKVRNMATLGGPHMGVDAVPHCLSGPLCWVVNSVVKKIIYLDVVQDLIAPAGYFRDVNNMKQYEAKSAFLSDVNNEHDKMGYTGLTETQEHRKRSLSSINEAMFVMFSEDTMIYPKETAWFQTLDKSGDVLPLNQTAWYKDDLIGIKTLVDSDRAHFVTFEGDHLHFGNDQINNIVVPFLKQ